MMFSAGDIVSVLIPNVINAGYDYRLTAPADIGDYVHVTVMNRHYVGVIIGPGAGDYDASRIKAVLERYDFTHMSLSDIEWIRRMSEWTLMKPGAVLRLILNVPDAFFSPRIEQLYAYNFANDARMTPSRLAVMDAFSSNDNDAMTISDIQNIAHVSGATVRSMVRAGILTPTTARDGGALDFIHEYRDVGGIELNAEQQSAANRLGAAVRGGGFSVYLLDGVTGSGKTQVYFDAAFAAYSGGKSVLLMMPEIALTAQFFDRFTSRFGAPPVVWHSNLTASRRRDIWRGVARGQIRVIVGTRSALFLPWQDLGLIIIDEEHDTSYKQEDMGNYHARDMAILRAKIAGFPVILASATPSLETLHNVAQGKYERIRLTSRFGGAALPTITACDMRENRPVPYKPTPDSDAVPGNLGPQLCEMISDTLAARNQVLLFINRRGYAPIIQCTHCGWVGECPDCSAGLNYHKHINKMVCHICGKTLPLPQKCPRCGNAVSLRGAGLERIEDEVKARFPHARTALVSSDTITSRGALERTVHRMENGEIDIIIGTQILAKGHHFPNLTLVGVIDADMGLFGPDFRAGEHTFQQLFQVSGRAGRGATPGRVILQTYQPENPVIRAICDGDRDAFYALDMQSRRAAGMPPFGQLIAVIIEADNESRLKKYCAALGAAAPKLNGGKIMGPVPAQIYQIRNWYRMRFLVSGPFRANLQPIVRDWLDGVPPPTNTRVKIDVNPQSFM